MKCWPATVLALAVMAVMASGCDTFNATTVMTPAAVSDSAAAASPEIRLASGDKVRITVFGEDKLSGEYQVDTGGFVSLPLAGSLMAAGLTGPELERALEGKFKGTYLRNPRVTVEVLTFRPFYVLGEVTKPGEYPFRSGLNVLSAIAIAGGATYRASTSKVSIQRSGSTEMKEYPQSPTVRIYPGDLIRVPERYF
jgi:polysaccharide export outer membrane protein